MRAIVTDEQRRSRTEAGLPSIEIASPKRGDSLKKGRALLRGDLRRSSVAYSRYAPSASAALPPQVPVALRPASLLVAPQNRPAKSKGIYESLH